MTVEYLAPGVYVEEIATSARPIEGVSTSTASYTGVYLVDMPIVHDANHGESAPGSPRLDRDLVVALERLAAHSPEWTNPNAGDPGITLVELFASLAENALYRAERLPERSLRAYARLACAALAILAGDKAKGMREMSVIAVLGAGVVEGLELSLGGGERLTISPGMAVDPRGDDKETGGDDPSGRHRAVLRRKDP